MIVVFSREHERLDPVYEVARGRREPVSDVAARAEQIRSALAEGGDHSFIEPSGHGEAPILAVHDEALLRFLAGAWERWSASGEVDPLFPDTMLHRSMREGMGPVASPSGVAAQMGFFCFDTFTPIVAGTYVAARAAVDVALTGVDVLLAGEGPVYALTRPPGHHAGIRVFAGSSYLNQAAIAAQALTLSTDRPVAILDIDFHHGNGSQQIFWDRGDVLYVSIHGDPTEAYPYFTGHANERGGGDGEGATLNLPLPMGTDDAAYVRALDVAIAAIAAVAPAAVVVSVGFDTYGLDDGGGFELTNDAYLEIGARIGSLGRDVLLVQEGGYFVPHLGRNAVALVAGIEAVGA